MSLYLTIHSFFADVILRIIDRNNRRYAMDFSNTRDLFQNSLGSSSIRPNQTTSS